jgi:hypothetical protein
MQYRYSGFSIIGIPPESGPILIPALRDSVPFFFIDACRLLAVDSRTVSHSFIIVMILGQPTAYSAELLPVSRTGCRSLQSTGRPIYTVGQVHACGISAGCFILGHPVDRI